MVIKAKQKPEPKLQVGHFKKGDWVRYVPPHANGDQTHKDCRNGVVSSVNDRLVFVKYDNLMCAMLNGDEEYTANGTSPGQWD